MTSELPPPELPKYRFVRNLGHGGYADVFLYHQDSPNRDVAVKVLRQSADTDEADTMAMVSDHEHIVSIYGCEIAPDDRLCLVMAYYPGLSFDERYNNGPLTIDEVLQTGVKLCGALATAHQAGILHRDIKPSNILTSPYGEPGLTDFGIAVSTTGAHIQEGASLPWAPPEVLEQRAPDVRADVYGIAATLFTLLEGHAPYTSATESNDDRALIARTLTGTVPTLQRADAPASLTRLLQVAMARDPDLRVATAEQFGRELQKIETERGLSATPLRIPLPPSVDHPRPRVHELRDDPNRTKLKLPAVVDADADLPDDRPIARLVQTPPPLPPPPQVPLRDTLLISDGPVADEPRHRQDPSVPAVAPLPSTPPQERTKARSEIASASPVAVRSSSHWGWITGAAAAVIAVVVIGAFVFGGDDGTGDDGGDNELVTTVPMVALARVADLTMTATGPDTALVTWKGPDSLDGGHFNWSRCDSADPTTNKTAEEEVTITGLSPGERVCVEVSFQAADGNESDEERVEIAKMGEAP